MGCPVLGCGGREDRGDHRGGGGAHLLAMIAVPHRTRLLLGHESQRPYESEELLDSVQQDEGEQRTAEEQEALSDALSTITQVPFTA
ncbi:hypothetical protein QQF64_018076 [Cirrhinus molitorella]|uniref:Uncharacterized protein n=1 Tax=Cirrhinus molitorella TaxID=172907 RepID=A0ABR3LPJ3_9TELE